MINTTSDKQFGLKKPRRPAKAGNAARSTPQEQKRLLNALDEMTEAEERIAQRLIRLNSKFEALLHEMQVARQSISIGE